MQKCACVVCSFLSLKGLDLPSPLLQCVSFHVCLFEREREKEREREREREWGMCALILSFFFHAEIENVSLFVVARGV